jgi:NAD(P)-dependent dehydrogenase (short-subunit alcohol dehydrogenase family)
MSSFARNKGVIAMDHNAIKEKDFTGKVAVITGGATGLGLEISTLLAQRGASVVIASRKLEHLQAAAVAISEAGGAVMTVPIDVRKEDDVKQLLDATTARFGPVDILVNNAAGNFITRAEELSVNGFRTVVDIVLNGTFICSSVFGRQMLARGTGTILNIVANYAGHGQPGVVHSAAAKSGVLSLTETMAVEWGPQGVRVNALAPGAMVTDGASTNLQYDNAGAQEKICGLVPLRRLTSAKEMAALAVFLLSDAAAYVNGETFTADGGASLRRGFLDVTREIPHRK